MKNITGLALQLSFYFLLICNVDLAQTAPSAVDTGRLKIKHVSDFAVNGEGTAANWATTDWVMVPCRSDAGTAYATKLKLLYSDSGIYCLYQCEDKKITATLTADFTDLYNEDVVEVFLRSDENQPLYFEYELSPLNYELPIMVPNIRGNFYGWQPWHYEGARKTRHATHISKTGDTVTGWTAEFFIPYALLKPMLGKKPQKGDRWRANFYRIDYDKRPVTWQWNLVRKESFHDFERFGVLLFD